MCSASEEEREERRENRRRKEARSANFNFLLFWAGNDSGGRCNLDSIFRQKYKEERQAEEAETREAEENQEQG